MNGFSLRWLVRALLVASLALNVSFAWMLWSPQPAPSGGVLRTAAPVAALERIAKQLPADERAVLRDALLLRAVPMSEAQSRYQLQVARVLELVAAADVDVAALAQEIEAARTSRREATDQLVAGFLEALPKMSLATRRDLAAGAPR